MTQKMTYEEAKKRVEEIRGFFWPALGWGIGLAFHDAGVFIEHGPFGKAWEEKKIRELMGERRPGDKRP